MGQQDEVVTFAGRVTESSETALVFRLKEQGGSVETWTFAVDGRKLKLKSVMVDKGRRHISDVSGVGEVKDGTLRAKFEWTLDMKRLKNAKIAGVLELAPTNDAGGDD